MIPQVGAGSRQGSLAQISQIEDRIRESVGPVGVRIVGPERPAFHHEWRSSYIGPTLLTNLRALQIERREGALAERWADCVFLVVQEQGIASCREAGREFRAHAGEMVLVDPCLSSSIGSEGACQFLAYTIPRKLVTSLQERGLNPMHRVIGPAAGITRMLSGTLNAMLDPAYVDIRATRSAYQVVSDLLAAALQAEGEMELDQDTALVEAMRDWAIERVGIRRITIPDLSRSFGLSERSLYRLFAKHGTTPDRWLWRCRVEAATARLETQRASVKTIALEAGFKNVPHFTRLFRDMHGIPPTEYRRRIES